MTERKENVRWTFLANGPGGAVARLSYTQDKDGELQIIDETDEGGSPNTAVK